MTWLQFLLWVAGLYTLYYLLLVLLDMSGKDRTKAGAAMSHELTFSEPVEVQQLSPEPEAAPAADRQPVSAFSQERVMAPQPGAEVIGSGGVSLKALFSMARDESILYTRSVSY